MALPESAFTNPYWIRYREGATLSRDDNRRFDRMEMAYDNSLREWRDRPRPGYNAQDPITKEEKVNLRTDAPYIRAR